MIHKQYNTATQSRVENTDNKNAQNAQKKETKMKKVIKMDKNQKELKVKLPNGAYIDIFNYINDMVTVEVKHYDTCITDEVKVVNFVQYEKASETTSYSHCVTTFEEGTKVTKVSHRAFNK